MMKMKCENVVGCIREVCCDGNTTCWFYCSLFYYVHVSFYFLVVSCPEFGFKLGSYTNVLNK